MHQGYSRYLHSEVIQPFGALSPWALRIAMTILYLGRSAMVGHRAQRPDDPNRGQLPPTGDRPFPYRADNFSERYSNQDTPLPMSAPAPESCPAKVRQAGSRATFGLGQIARKGHRNVENRPCAASCNLVSDECQAGRRLRCGIWQKTPLLCGAYKMARNLRIPCQESAQTCIGMKNAGPRDE